MFWKENKARRRGRLRESPRADPGPSGTDRNGKAACAGSRAERAAAPAAEEHPSFLCHHPQPSQHNTHHKKKRAELQAQRLGSGEHELLKKVIVLEVHLN